MPPDRLGKRELLVEDVPMYQVTVSPEHIQRLHWPGGCFHCGGVVPDSPSTRVQFDVSGWKSVSSGLCNRCDRRKRAWDTLGTVGGLLVLLAFIGPVVNKTTSPKEIEGAGGCFFLGAILASYAGARSKRITAGTVSGRLGKAGELMLGFSDRGLAERFCSLNAVAPRRVPDRGSRRAAIVLLVLGVLLVAAASPPLFGEISGNRRGVPIGPVVVLESLGVLIALIGWFRFRAAKRT